MKRTFRKRIKFKKTKIFKVKVWHDEIDDMDFYDLDEILDYIGISGDSE